MSDETLDQPPACPICSMAMVSRRRRSDGGSFWGCPSYPSCRGTRPVLGTESEAAALAAPAHAPRVNPGVAGGSARHRYERLHDQREARITERFGTGWRARIVRAVTVERPASPRR